MCGIVGYIGYNQAYPFLLQGLKRLEYRGYDSAGVALLNGDLHVYKKRGKVTELEKEIANQPVEGNIGIGHTRWATHGKPDDINAHPHVSYSGNIAVVHNGTIENNAILRTYLTNRGHEFVSETDTEVLAHLIEDVQKSEGLELDEAVRLALLKVVGAYAIAVVDRNQPDFIVAAKKSSPLVVGLSDHGLFLASDASPLVDYVKHVTYLEDEQIVTLHKSSELTIKNLQNQDQSYQIMELDLEIEKLEKGGYDYFMLKEIFEQPNTLKESMRGRVNIAENIMLLGGVKDNLKRFLNAKKLIIVGCGTSWHSALIGEYLIEDLARIPVEVEYASEFRYRNPIIGENDIVIAISQSGETADTRAALELAKAKGAFTYGIVNVVGSSIARLTDAGSYIHAGPEIGVASTKAFTGQVTMLTILAGYLGWEKGVLSDEEYHNLMVGLEGLPQKISKVLDHAEKIEYIAGDFSKSSNALYLGRGYNFPVALEGALKLKEISYIHAEGYPAAEMKHGPIALIDEQMPVFVIATNVSAYDKIVSNIQEVKARGGIVIAVVNENDTEIVDIADHVIEIPLVLEPLTPLLSVIPLQLLSYYIAVARDCDVDQPRNLAKSVTVE